MSFPRVGKKVNKGYNSKKVTAVCPQRVWPHCGPLRFYVELSLVGVSGGLSLAVVSGGSPWLW